MQKLVQKESLFYFLFIFLISCRWFYYCSGPANLVTVCLADCGIQTTLVTFDALSVNFSLLKTLGASVDPEKLNSHISYDEFEKPVNLLLDNCHWIKNIQNAFSDLGVLYNGDGRKIILLSSLLFRITQHFILPTK